MRIRTWIAHRMLHTVATNIPRIAQRVCCRVNPDLLLKNRPKPGVETVRDG